MNYKLMEQQLVLHEGLRLKPYLDTEGILTCLVGYNVDARGWDFVNRTLGRKVTDNGASGFTRNEALAVLRADIERVEKVVRTYFPEYDKLDEVRQRVCVDMAFNLGGRLLQFKRAIAAAKERNWSKVTRELYNSKWANQVDDGQGGRFGRADRLAQMVLTGLEPTDPGWLQHIRNAA